MRKPLAQYRGMILVSLLATLLFLLIGAQPVSADGIIIIDPPFPEPPPPDFNRWLSIRYHRVTVTIDNQVATTEVDQVFRNDANVPVEGTYVFPLPPEATVEDFMMWVDGEPLESRILPADEARQIYESYVRRNQDPALLEYIGRDAVQARIFPIPAHEERRVRLRYTQVLPVEDDLLAYRYPLDTERFSAHPLEEVSVVVKIDSPVDLGAIYSPSHQDKIEIVREGERNATISYEAGDVLPDRDFELYVGARTEALGAQLLSYNPRRDDGFFLLLIAPPLVNEEIELVSRDVILVLDTSGSMEGEKLAQAKAGLIDVLQRLNPEDHFNIVAFSSQTRSYAPTPAPAAEAASAIDWIEELEALGGTNIYLALSEALAQVERERATTIVFLTDGLPTEGIVEEELLLAALEKEAPEATHIFPFGVGYDVNVLLLDALAQNHRGRPTYVEPDERIDEAVSTLYARMQSPLLTDVEVALERGDVNIYDVYPTELPDVYAGMQMIVTGRYTGRGADSLTISGRVNDRPVTYRYAVDFEDHDGAAFVPRLWATRKIGYLLTQIRLHGSQTEWIDAVVDLSLKYGIITPYTSFLIEEPQETLTQEGRDRAAEEMELEMQAVPTLSSGAGAVEDAKLREGLGGAEAPAGGGGYALDESEEGSAESGSARTRTIRYIGEKTFLCTAERCTDTDFVPDDMTPQEVTFLSDHYDELLVEDDIWARYFSLAEETIVVAEDGMAYRLLLGDPEAMPEVQSPAPDSTTSPTEDSGANTAPTVTPPTDTPSEDPTASVSEEDPEDARGGTGICAAASLLLVPLIVTVAKGRRR